MEGGCKPEIDSGCIAVTFRSGPGNSGQSCVVHLVIHFMWKEKWPEVEYIVFWVVRNGFTSWSRAWEKEDKIKDKEVKDRASEVKVCS